MGRMQRNKGARVERQIVKLHADEGIDCTRVPLSGASAHTAKCDLLLLGGPREGGFGVEVKARRNAKGFARIVHRIDESAAGFIALDALVEDVTLYCMTWHVYVRLVREGELPAARDVGRLIAGTSTVVGWLTGSDDTDLLMLRRDGITTPFVVMLEPTLDRLLTRSGL